MTFTNKLSSILNKASDRLEEAVHKQSSAPHIPYASKPSSSSQQYPAHNPDHGPSQPPNPPPPSHNPYWQPSLSSPIDTSFRHELGAHGWGNAEAQNYTSSPANSFLSPAGIHVHAIAASSHPDPSQRYTSARLTSHQLLSRDRGVLSARITAPIARGVWPAFWLLPADPFSWPGDGEVDIFEAWDGSAMNHSCLHWGYFNGEDWDKHRVIETDLGSRILGRGVERDGVKTQVGGMRWQEKLGGREGMGTGAGVSFEFAWDDREGKEGRFVWYIDGRAVMKARKPAGTRRMREWRILINIAMGGNVCKGRLPEDGVYEMVVRDLTMSEGRDGGWEGFESDFREAKEGHP
ncbi:glycoside hydrolase family 16 protein [Myriangium duriaei CBS 260.36]|uniref:Glycoside hydrolase family 16 protein n=1 Tax=Myriangium duriaei CBS 260.36 TaxID=1168546 RepID=A0A9P4MJ57_9PEZI|nr:glycoside hydrolase family 16 protein [Myriangium duriaei CBS 260.36]